MPPIVPSVACVPLFSILFFNTISTVRYTQTTLKKIEEIFGELDYSIRYEKGNFQSGYCLVENRRIAVVNRFYDTEARINCLMEILSQVEFDPETLSEKSQELIAKWKKNAEAEAPEGENAPETKE